MIKNAIRNKSLTRRAVGNQGNIHFGGEHCSVNFQGYMEGGAEEGQRAASEILADLGVK